MALTKVKGSGLATGAATASLVGIDDNATSTKLTVANTGIDVTGSVTCDELNVSTVGTNRVDISNTSLTDTGEMVSLQWDTNADFTIQGRDSAAGFKANWYRIEASASDGLADSHIWYTGTSAEAMRITSAGNVGIGTSSPSNPLEIQHGTVGTGNGANNTLALRYDSSTLYGQHYMDANGIYHILADDNGVAGGNMQLGADTTIRLATANTERMRITSAGNVGIGTTSPAAKLDVNGTLACDGFTSTGIDDNATTELLQLDATNSIVRVGDVLNTANTQLHFRQSAIDGTHYIISYANTKHLAIKNQDAAGDLYFSAGGAERMRIDSAGIVTTPYQPAFSAYLSASVSVAAGWHSVTPNTTYFNVGNDYSTSTGYFTAPVSGKYLISATYHSNVTTNYLYIGVLVNNVNSTPYFEGRRTVNDEYTSDNTLGGSTILNLAAGDTVRLRCYSDVAFSISGGNTRTSFSGYLLG